MKRLLTSLALLLLVVGTTAAQSLDCPAIAQRILETAREVCPTVEANQACYAGGTLAPEPRENIRLRFADPGDQVSLSALKGLSGSAYDPQAETLGLAILNVRASLPKGGLTMLLVGDARLENQSQAANDFISVTVTVKETRGANLRAEPADSAALVGSLSFGAAFQAVQRTEDAAWVRVISGETSGWVSTALVNPTADVMLLSTALPSLDQSLPRYGPMQTIRFRSAQADAGCPGLPDSGLLVQTPEGQAVELVVNNVSWIIAGTIWFQTTPEGATITQVLEGTIQAVPPAGVFDAGTQFTYGFRGAKVFIQPDGEYNFARARYQPLPLLPREFELPFSLGGVIFPFTPGTGFLQGIGADGPCTAAWTVDVNLRAGPGTNYPIRRGVPGGFYGQPDARAVGSDGEIWWRLVEGVWVAANLTAAGGNCGTIPLVAPPPIPANSN